MYLYTVGLLTPARSSAPRRLCVPASTCEILLLLMVDQQANPRIMAVFLSICCIPSPVVKQSFCLLQQHCMCEHSKPTIPAGLGCLAEQLIFRVRQIDTDVIRRFAPLLPEQHFFREEWISLCVVFLFVGVPDIMQSSKRKGAGAVKQFDVIREARSRVCPVS